MKRKRLVNLSVALGSVGLLFVLGGCQAGATQVTFLDILNTVLLGITAAGGVVLLNNA